MSSLRSSSALAVNAFDPWRGKDLSPIAKAIGVPGDLTEIHFEQRLPHGLGSFPPNLDLALFRQTGPPIGVESKFCEPYDGSKQHPPIDRKYFEGERRRWEALGLVRCEDLARRIGVEESFVHLGAGQLLKHLLALTNVFGGDAGVHLLYIWFDSGCGEAQAHRLEIVRFHGLLDKHVSFISMTYQDLFAAFQEHQEPVPGYFAYIADRYLIA